jgi:hypothetical protein
MLRNRRFYLYAFVLLVFSGFMYGCASWGIARLPSKQQLFVSTSPEDGFVLSGDLDYPYQPLGYVAVDSVEFTPCSFLDPLKQAYRSLEKVLSDKLVEKAKNEMGADGVINVTWTAAPSVLTYVTVRGLAVKRK